MRQQTATPDAGARDILAARAAALARPVDYHKATTTIEVLVVTVADGQRFALQTCHIRRILRNTRLSRLPAGCGALLGLVLTRDDTVPVADLAELLDLAPAQATRPFIVILDDTDLPLGLLVDGVNTVVRFAASDLQEASHRADNTVVAGLGLAPDGVVVLDGRALLRDDRVFLPRDPPGSPADRPPSDEPGAPCEQ